MISNFVALLGRERNNVPTRFWDGDMTITVDETGMVESVAVCCAGSTDEAQAAMRDHTDEIMAEAAAAIVAQERLLDTVVCLIADGRAEAALEALDRVAAGSWWHTGA